MLSEPQVLPADLSSFGAFASSLYAELYQSSRAQLSGHGGSSPLVSGSPAPSRAPTPLPLLSPSSPDPVLRGSSLANQLNRLATLERPVQLVDANRPNPLQNPNGQGPIGPRTRHKRFVVVNLEYPDYNPSDPPAEFARVPLRPANPALYLEYMQHMVHKDKIICAGFQPEVAAGGLHHIQGFYTDTRKKPTYIQPRDVWGFRGVPLQSWQYRSYDCDNPIGAWNYSVKGPDYRDPATGLPDTGKRMEGGYPRTFGMPPPPGPIARGGHRDGSGRGADGAPGGGKRKADDVDMVAWAKHIEEMGKQKKTKREIYTDPKIISALKPSQNLLETIHRLHDRPADPDPNYRRRVVILVGAGGSGKSYRVREYCRVNGISLWEAPAQKDGYGGFFQRYAGEKAALFEEGHSWISFEAFLRATQDQESLQDQKHGDCVFRPDFIFITTNRHPEKWLWNFAGEKKARPLRDYDEEKKPFYRRLDWGGIFHWVDDDFHEMQQAFLPDVADGFDPEPKRYYLKVPRLYNYPHVKWDPPHLLRGELRLSFAENRARGVDAVFEQAAPIYRAPPPLSPPPGEEEPHSPEMRTPVSVDTPPPVSPLVLQPGVDYMPPTPPTPSSEAAAAGGDQHSERSVSLGENSLDSLDITGLNLEVVAPPDSPDAHIVHHTPILADLLAAVDEDGTPDFHAQQLAEQSTPGSSDEDNKLSHVSSVTPDSDMERAIEDQDEERLRHANPFLLLDVSEQDDEESF